MSTRLLRERVLTERNSLIETKCPDLGPSGVLGRGGPTIQAQEHLFRESKVVTWRPWLGFIWLRLTDPGIPLCNLWVHPAPVVTCIVHIACWVCDRCWWTSTPALSAALEPVQSPESSLSILGSVSLSRGLLILWWLLPAINAMLWIWGRVLPTMKDSATISSYWRWRPCDFHQASPSSLVVVRAVTIMGKIHHSNSLSGQTVTKSICNPCNT
jgi:hypothetical protein